MHKLIENHRAEARTGGYAQLVDLEAWLEKRTSTGGTREGRDDERRIP